MPAAGNAVSAVALGLFGGFAVHYLTRGGLLLDPGKGAVSTCGGCGPSPSHGGPV